MISGAALTLSGSTTETDEAYTLDLPQYDRYNYAITQWVIDWGDGVVTTASGNPASQTHPYGNGTQSYTITAVGSSSAGNFKGTLTPVSITDVGPSGLVLDGQCCRLWRER